MFTSVHPMHRNAHQCSPKYFDGFRKCPGSSLSRCLKSRKPEPLSPRPPCPPAAIVPASCRRPCGSRSQHRTAYRRHSPPALNGSYRRFDRNGARPLRFSLPQVGVREKKTTCESENLRGRKKMRQHAGAEAGNSALPNHTAPTLLACGLIVAPDQVIFCHSSQRAFQILLATGGTRDLIPPAFDVRVLVAMRASPQFVFRVKYPMTGGAGLVLYVHVLAILRREITARTIAPAADRAAAVGSGTACALIAITLVVV
jgi:hypothetical protein